MAIKWFTFFLASLASTGGTLVSAENANDEKPWTVERTDQPYKDVSFTLSEGTWMSLDISPDGKTIVFDLLGDLYSMPATGGKAEILKGGAAMDRLPSFSPDGSKILFISDQNGFDNIWTILADGSRARMITNETANLPMNPTWAPDSTYIAAASMHNTFATQKMSEIRLYHTSGGTGKTLVDIPESKRDVQEPDFSSDGKYLYYTERLVNHGIFIDANHLNYAVMRRDMATGASEAILKGFGGALSPQVSPDNKRIAFVRRVKEKTVLFVYNLATGEQRPVYDALSRDHQADFYLQGVYYPGYDWFPDNIHVAIWAKGKLHKVNMNTGAAVEIPFEVTSNHRIISSPKFADELAPNHVYVRAIRNMVSSPDGKELLFHALGYLWKKPLPHGKPSRLTKTSAFEFEPSYSPDGKRLTYVTWDDEKGSALVVATAKGKRAKTLVASRGVIRQPSFSQDGKSIVYAIEDGGKTMGGYRAKPGIYHIPLRGGSPSFVTAFGDAPKFSADGRRIYISRTSGGDTTRSSVTLEGHAEQKHAIAISADRSEITLSPDRHWLAFKEDQQYFVMPYHETGQVTDVSATSTAVPVATLTETSGYNLGWTADSKNVQWTLGADFYRTDVAALFQSGATLPQPVGRIDLSVKADKPEGIVAFVGGRIITQRADEVIEAGTVLVDGNRIIAVGKMDEIDIPDGAHIVNTNGKTVMPGFVDMHGHIECCYYGGLMPQKHSSLYAASAFGVTTNYDPYTAELSAYATSEMQKTGAIVGPRFLSSGRVIYGRAGKGDKTFVPLDSYEDAVNVMLRKRALGGRIIKSYKQPSRKVRQQLVKAGRQTGIMVDVEGESHFYYNISMILDGHMALEHNIPVATYYDDIIQLFSHSEAAHTPTLNVTFGEIMGENHLYQTTRAWEDPKIITYVQEANSGYSAISTPYSAPVHVRNMTTLHAAEEIWDVGFRSISRSTKKLDDAGVTINAGSHGQVYGLAFHWEMWSMAQGGMDNHRILRTATINGAKTLGLDHDIGSLEVGKLADIIVLDKNPLDDIKNTNSVRYTMINGRLYDSLSMNEVGNYNKPRTKFYWELNDYNGIDWNEAWAGQ